MLEERSERNKLRHLVISAEKEEIITKDEVAFIVALVENGRKEIETKASKISMMKGEISQLKESRISMAEIRNEGPLAGANSPIVGILATRLNADLEQKEMHLEMLKGEIAQLKATEQSIINVIDNLIKAKERDIARQEVARKLRDAREVEKDREKQRKNALLKEQGDTVKENKADVEAKSGLHVPEGE